MRRSGRLPPKILAVFMALVLASFQLTPKVALADETEDDELQTQAWSDIWQAFLGYVDVNTRDLEIARYLARQYYSSVDANTRMAPIPCQWCDVCSSYESWYRKQRAQGTVPYLLIWATSRAAQGGSWRSNDPQASLYFSQWCDYYGLQYSQDQSSTINAIYDVVYSDRQIDTSIRNTLSSVANDINYIESAVNNLNSTLSNIGGKIDITNQRLGDASANGGSVTAQLYQIRTQLSTVIANLENMNSVITTINTNVATIRARVVTYLTAIGDAQNGGSLVVQLSKIRSVLGGDGNGDTGVTHSMWWYMKDLHRLIQNQNIVFGGLANGGDNQWLSFSRYLRRMYESIALVDGMTAEQNNGRGVFWYVKDLHRIVQKIASTIGGQVLSDDPQWLSISRYLHYMNESLDNIETEITQIRTAVRGQKTVIQYLLEIANNTRNIEMGDVTVNMQPVVNELQNIETSYLGDTSTRNTVIWLLNNIVTKLGTVGTGGTIMFMTKTTMQEIIAIGDMLENLEFVDNSDVVQAINDKVIPLPNLTPINNAITALSTLVGEGFQAVDDGIDELHTDLLAVIQAIKEIPAGDVSIDVEPDSTPSEQLTVDFQRLKTKFPFSIPWDLLAILELFQAAPLTPEFDITLSYPGISSLELQYDLHDFDGVASVSRTCSLIMFTCGLLFNTKRFLSLDGE